MARDTKRDMVISAVEVMRERGVDGVTLDAVLSRSGAPRGSIYHHFPGGRGQLLDEAVEFAGDAISSVIERAAGKGSTTLLDTFAAFWKKILTEGDFGAGCPVLSAAVSGAPDADLTARAGTIFDRWCGVLRDAFVSEGLGAPTAMRLARTVLASTEGAVVLCRAARSTEPLDDVVEQLTLLVESLKLFANVTKSGSRARRKQGRGP